MAVARSGHVGRYRDPNLRPLRFDKQSSHYPMRCRDLQLPPSAHSTNRSKVRLVATTARSSNPRPITPLRKSRTADIRASTGGILESVVLRRIPRQSSSLRKSAAPAPPCKNPASYTGHWRFGGSEDDTGKHKPKKFDRVGHTIRFVVALFHPVHKCARTRTIDRLRREPRRLRCILIF